LIDFGRACKQVFGMSVDNGSHPVIGQAGRQLQSAASLPRLMVRMACDSDRVFSGSVRLAELPRLLPFVPQEAPETSLDFDLRFFRDEGRAMLAQLDVQTTVQVDCARCLQPMSLPLTGSSLLQFVYNDDQAEQVGDAREPVLVDAEGGVTISDLLEEEVLMAIPTVAMHDYQCQPVWREDAVDEDAAPVVERPERPNPFAALAEQWNGSSAKMPGAKGSGKKGEDH
jgi:uncharacterized protein